MSANSFGQILKYTSFGESHGLGLGVVIEGMPAGLKFNTDILKDFLARRRPGASPATSGRNENDEFEIISGIFENKSIGTPIAIIVRNKDARSEDYQQIKDKSRPGHADDMWKNKFAHTDHRGGGRSSGRETVARVIAGAFAKMLVLQLNKDTQVLAYPEKVGSLSFNDQHIDAKAMWSLNKTAQKDIESFLEKAKLEGQSFGGVAKVLINHPSSSLGQPVMRKLKSDLALLSMSLGATQGFELADGFAVAEQEGVAFHSKNSDQYGGIRGGLTTGETITYRVAFKPTSSVLDIAKKGRHDPCIVLRALVVLEAMTWFALADHMLWRRLDNV